MGLGACYSCVKYLMFAFNFVFWLLGCAILGVGIWVRADPDFRQYVDSAEEFNYLYTGSYILITVGVLIMFIGFLGCCGAIRESQWMLISFFVSLVLILACLLATGIWAVLAKESLKGSVTETLQSAVRHYEKDAKSKAFIDSIMLNFECCGASKGAVDFTEANINPVPLDTCKLPLWNQPCDSKLFHYFSENLIIMAGIAIGVSIVMLLGMVFSMMLCCAIREAQY